MGMATSAGAGGSVQVCAHCVYAWADKPDTWQCPVLLPEKQRERRTLRKAFTGSRSGLCRGGMEGGDRGPAPPRANAQCPLHTRSYRASGHPELRYVPLSWAVVHARLKGPGQRRGPNPARVPGGAMCPVCPPRQCLGVAEGAGRMGRRWGGEGGGGGVGWWWRRGGGRPRQPAAQFLILP